MRCVPGLQRLRQAGEGVTSCHRPLSQLGGKKKVTRWAAATGLLAAGQPEPPCPGLGSGQGLTRQLRTTEHSRGWRPLRCFSNAPETAVYTGPKAEHAKRVTLRTLRGKYSRGEPISMVTAYDYPSAVHVDQAGTDMLLVGDSAAMVVHGHDTTLPVTLDEMLTHCRAASRGARRCFLIGDLPFGCYEASSQEAVRSAVRVLKEGNMDAIKMEGGSGAREAAARAIVAAGVATMGHVGLMPQTISVLGGFRPQGQDAASALRVMQEALALQDAGCFAMLLECLPAVVAGAITRQLAIPTIGIGAGPLCSGQVLVYHDLLGMMQHPHYVKVTPKFCKQYGAVGAAIQEALQAYNAEVHSGAFPSAQFSPYRIPDAEVKALQEELVRRNFTRGAEAVEEARETAHSQPPG